MIKKICLVFLLISSLLSYSQNESTANNEAMEISLLDKEEVLFKIKVAYKFKATQIESCPIRNSADLDTELVRPEIRRSLREVAQTTAGSDFAALKLEAIITSINTNMSRSSRLHEKEIKCDVQLTYLKLTEIIQ